MRSFSIGCWEAIKIATEEKIFDSSYEIAAKSVCSWPYDLCHSLTVVNSYSLLSFSRTHPGDSALAALTDIWIVLLVSNYLQILLL